ncbi:MAG TPA: cytidylate kinase-like family protein [Ktedonobacterales bacterium]|nr:cytidylate kinase-like family protein [Ktedonobacterales bacterium]
MSESTESASVGALPPEMRAITISRQYGSGGGEIAARLARRLGWRLVDHEVIEEVARRLGVTVDDAAQRDERAEGVVDHILRGFRAAEPAPPSLLSFSDPLMAPQAYDYAVALHETLLGVVAIGRAVIVGRGAQALLQERGDALHVRIVAPLEQRILYVSRREALDHDAALRRIQRKDHDRQRYLWLTHARRVEDITLYDLILNTSILDFDSCVDLIALALERKASLLTLAPDALGPGASAPRYPGMPSDLPALVPSDAPPEPDQPSALEGQPS